MEPPVEGMTRTSGDQPAPGAARARTPREAAAVATGRLTSAWRQWVGSLASEVAEAERVGVLRAQGAPDTSFPDTEGGLDSVAPGSAGEPGDRRRRSERSAADRLLGLANIARFEWDLPSGRVTWGVVPIHDETLASVDHIEVLMQHCHPADLERLRADMQTHVHGRQAVARSEFRLRSVRGTWRWYALCGRVVDADDGEPRRFAGLMQDIDERRRAMQTRSTQDALFADGPVRLVTLGGNASGTPRDLYAELAALLAGDSLPAMPGLTALGPGPETPPRRLRDVVHADDVGPLKTSVELAQKRPGRPQQLDLRVVDGLGGWRRVRLQLAAEKDATADPAQRVEGTQIVHAYLLDADDPAVAPPAQEGDERLRAVVRQLGQMQRVLQDLQRLNEMLQLCDGEADARRIVAEGAAGLFPSWRGEVRVTDAEGHQSTIVAWGGDEDGAGATSAPTAPADAESHRITFPLVVGTQHGELHMLPAMPVDEAELRSTSWAAASFAEALGLSLGNVRLREQAVQDWLTGLYNRRWFDDALRRESRRAQRSGEGFTLAILDIDHFKSFNDAFGHDAGDEVLRAVAHEMKAFGRAMDTPCRIGGEEMAVLMPRARIEDACERLEELRERIAALHLHHEGTPLPTVTVSIGVADCHEGRAQNLQRRADIALYAAKHGGRNRVCCWEPGMEEMSGFGGLDARPSSLGI